MKIISEFRTFAMRGNVIDMAAGVIIGAGFGKLVDSAVKDLLMPPLGFVVGGIDFSAMQLVLKKAHGFTPPVAVKYGLFLNAVVSFTIVAFAVFMLVRAFNGLKKTGAVKPAAALPTREEILLTEIRDLLRQTRPMAEMKQ